MCNRGIWSISESTVVSTSLLQEAQTNTAVGLNYEFIKGKKQKQQCYKHLLLGNVTSQIQAKVTAGLVFRLSDSVLSTFDNVGPRRFM